MEPSLAPIVAAVEGAVADLMADGATPGMAVCIVRGGTLAWSGGFGVADPFTGRLATADTLFRIASMTKPFTATAVLQLRDEGRLALHDPLVRHLPEAAAIEDPFGALDRVTIGQVLLHTAGLPSHVPMDDPRAAPGLTQEELLARLDRVRLVRPPDTRWHYSNLGYELLAILVARVTGEPYAERLARCVLEPAGLSDTTYHPTGALADRLAVGVLPGGVAGAWQRAPDEDSDRMLGDGGLWSTVDDLARWIGVGCHIGDDDRRGDGVRVLDGRSMLELQRPMALVDLDGWRSAQGPGWASFRIDDAVWQGHTGSTAGFRTIALLRAADGLGVVALTNGPERPNPVAHAAARALLAARPPTATTTPDEPPHEDGPGPLGRWVDPAFAQQLFVTDAGEHLVLAEPGVVPVELVPADSPFVWHVGGDVGSTGEAVRHEPEDGPGRPETLNVAGLPLLRAGD